MTNEVEKKSDIAELQNFWSQTITLRQIRKWVLILFVLGLLLYVWQFFRLEWHSKMGGLPAKTSPYYTEIPDDCKKFSNRHKWHTEEPDSFALRIRSIRLDQRYLQPQYGRIRCLGQAVLTGLHMQDPLDANFTDTYVDANGKPIVRISVEYLQPYVYNPAQRQPLKTEEQQ